MIGEGSPDRTQFLYCRQARHFVRSVPTDLRPPRPRAYRRRTRGDQYTVHLSTGATATAGMGLRSSTILRRVILRCKPRGRQYARGALTLIPCPSPEHCMPRKPTALSSRGGPADGACDGRLGHELQPAGCLGPFVSSSSANVCLACHLLTGLSLRRLAAAPG